MQNIYGTFSDIRILVFLDHFQTIFNNMESIIWHRLMKWEPVRLGDQSLQKYFMAVLFKIRSANVFLVFIFTANWVL